MASMCVLMLERCHKTILVPPVLNPISLGKDRVIKYGKIHNE